MEKRQSAIRIWLKLLTLIKIVPPSRGEAEHCFSLTKLVCTPLRNWLLQDAWKSAWKLHSLKKTYWKMTVTTSLKVAKNQQYYNKKMTHSKIFSSKNRKHKQQQTDHQFFLKKYILNDSVAFCRRITQNI